MPSFFAMLRDPHDPAAEQTARIVRSRILQRPFGPRCLEQEDGFDLYDLSPLPGPPDSLRLAHPDGRYAGTVFGTVFDRTDAEDPAAPLTRWSAAETGPLLLSGGQSLIDGYWGTYIAFLRVESGTGIIVDPTAAIPCYYYQSGNVLFLFSNLESCFFLDRHRLNPNYRFISALLAYDKILNGETGLAGVRELMGGQRLIFRNGQCEISTLWDPRAFARDRLDECPRELAVRLRRTVRHVVRSRAGSYDDVMVSLSGGLDSSIVLSCLADPPVTAAVRAAHFRLASEDTPEIDYAREAARAARFELLEIITDTLAGFGDIETYPLTVRPFRTLLAPDPERLLPPGGNRAALFTGQGGDHLFRTSRSPLGFADFLLNRRPGNEALSVLLDTARLSGESVGGVIGATLPALAGRSRASAMERGIASRRTLVNRTAHRTLDVAALLPDWARDPAGLPPGKFDQVSTLMHMIEVRDSLVRPGRRQTVHPLVSQPLIETCLRIPAYRLSAGGISRGLIRNAFSADLPASIRLRTTKGRASRFYMDRIRTLIDRCKASLLDGELVRNGLVCRTDMDAFMADEHLLREGSATMLLVYYGIEHWLRSWKQARQAAPFT